ncbi:MAG: hypothetical protein FWG12_02385 [Holophagaceae bacterium]|nr:hypothetical protein [Holophagaceae bacterium]
MALCILTGPMAVALLLRVLPPYATWLILNVAYYSLIVPILFAIYLAFKWVMGRGGAGWLWRLDLFTRSLIARFSSDAGGLWLKWARVAEDDRLARAMTERSAECGNPDGLYEWGSILKKQRMEDSALQAFLKAAQLGHSGAAWEVGEAARWGSCGPRDRALSRRWHEAAARKGYVPSLRILATALKTGDGLDVDLDAAQRWQKQLQTLMDQLGPSENLYGIDNPGSDLPVQTHEKGRANPISEIIGFLLRCADALISRTPQKVAQVAVVILFWAGGLFLLLWLSGGSIVIAGCYVILVLFLMVAYGRSVKEIRLSRALTALENRADKSEPDAMYELGMLYRNGSVHLPQDLSMAREWLLRAANSGHADAMLEAGQLLAWGFGGPKDQAQARHWLQRAKNLGRNEAVTYLQRMGVE